MVSAYFSNEVIATSGTKFGTSGVRGLVTDFTPDVVSAYVAAFIEQMQQKFDFVNVIVAIDNRPSSPEIAKFVCSCLAKLDLNVEFAGIVPTPALAFYAIQKSVPSIMVTGSHIPFDRNGIKFYLPTGEISKQDELKIISTKVPFPDVTSDFVLETKSEATDLYKARYINLFSNSTALTGVKIGVYEHSSSGRDIYANVLKQLGADVISLNRTDTFVAIDTEAVSQQDIDRAKVWVKEHHLDLLFSTDGDGDRPLIADEKGNWLRGDILGLLTSSILEVEAIATPINCNTAIETCNKFKLIKRTQIGSPYVLASIESLVDKYLSAGFEANGGFILASDCTLAGNKIQALPTRDALLPLFAILIEMKRSGLTLSELVNPLRNRCTASNRIQFNNRDKVNTLLTSVSKDPSILLNMLETGIQVNITNIELLDGIRMSLSNDTIVHLRVSGNAPELRIYVETNTEKMSAQLLEQCVEVIGNYLDH